MSCFRYCLFICVVHKIWLLHNKKEQNLNAHAHSPSSLSESLSDSSAIKNLRLSSMAATEDAPKTLHTSDWGECVMNKNANIDKLKFKREMRILYVPNPPTLPLCFFSSCAALCSSSVTRRKFTPPSLIASNKLALLLLLPFIGAAGGCGESSVDVFRNPAPAAPALIESKKLNFGGPPAAAGPAAPCYWNKYTV